MPNKYNVILACFVQALFSLRPILLDQHPTFHHFSLTMVQVGDFQFTEERIVEMDKQQFNDILQVTFRFNQDNLKVIFNDLFIDRDVGTRIESLFISLIDKSWL